ncbi:MAG: YigZ family protein, partial [Desulfuromonas sp.]
LTALQHGDIGDTAVVVTRYFGGIKLGKGGMVKAYTTAVQTALEQLPRTERVAWVELQASVDYTLKSLLERQLPRFEIEVLDIDYAQLVTYRLRLPVEQREMFRTLFSDLTAGKGLLQE